MDFNCFLIFILINLTSYCLCFEVLSGAGAGIGVVVASASFALRCRYFECCDDTWIHFDEQKFAIDLERHLFGQHLAKFALPRILRGFYRKNNRKALVMSFHGLTGSGKNYVASIIANATYEQGTDSSFVHIYSGVKDFTHKDRVQEYMDKLKFDISRFTRECGRSLFIFDEIDKMPPGVLDSLKPYIDYYEHIDGVDYRNNIFIFLSNAGSSGITELVLKFWAEGKSREEITMKNMEPLINRGAFNENGGLQFSELLRSSLIDVFIPFLPLEKQHVRRCIQAELSRRNIHDDPYLVKKIADEMLYFPENEELYSVSGCKRIEQKVDLFV